MKHPHAEKIMQFAKMVEAGHPIDNIVQTKIYGGAWLTVRPDWVENQEYRVALAFVEGKPVFEGDKLYILDLKYAYRFTVAKVDSKHSGERRDVSCFFSKTDCGTYNCEAYVDAVSWNPPKPETITVTLLRKDAEFLSGLEEAGTTYDRIADACKDALK